MKEEVVGLTPISKLTMFIHHYILQDYRTKLTSIIILMRTIMEISIALDYPIYITKKAISTGTCTRNLKEEGWRNCHSILLLFINLHRKRENKEVGMSLLKTSLCNNLDHDDCILMHL